MFRFYADAALTTPLTSLGLTSLFESGAGEALPAQVWFGNPLAGSVVAAAAGGNITVTPTDSASGSGLPANGVRLALSEAGLATATPGAALSLGTSIASGTAGAVGLWVAVDTGAAAAGWYADLSLATNNLRETTGAA